MNYTYKYHRNERFLFITDIQLSDKKIHIIVSLKFGIFLVLYYKLFYEHLKPKLVFQIKQSFRFLIYYFIFIMKDVWARVLNIVLNV